MSLGSDLILWLKAVAEVANEHDALHGIDGTQIDYAPAARKTNPDRLSIGVSAPPGIPSVAFGGGRMETRFAVSIFVTGKNTAPVEAAALAIEGQLSSFSGTLGFVKPTDYGDKVSILSAVLVASLGTNDEDQGTVNQRLEYEVLTQERG